MKTDPKVAINCYDCSVSPGQLHLDGCDVERCPCCGEQYITCDCDDSDDSRRMPWTGEWPGVAECREFGWYSVLITGQGWVSCSKDTPDATEDLNRLMRDARWNRDTQRWERP